MSTGDVHKEESAIKQEDNQDNHEAPTVPPTSGNPVESPSRPITRAYKRASTEAPTFTPNQECEE